MHRNLAALGALPLLLLGASCAAVRPARGPSPDAAGAAPPWGPVTAGLRLRVSGPETVARGERVEMDVEIGVVPERLPAGVHTIDARGAWYFARLSISPRGDGATVVVRCSDPTGGMPDAPPPPGEPGPHDPDGYPLREVRDAGLDGCRVTFPLATCWDRVPPGDYVVRVELALDDTCHGAPARGDWRGVVGSASFPLCVAPAPSVVQEVRLPSEAVGGDPGRTVTLRLPVRNGFTIGLRGDSLLAEGVPGDDFARDVQEALTPGSGAWEIFETSEEPAHMSSPGPGSPHYRTLWRGSLPPADR